MNRIMQILGGLKAVIALGLLGFILNYTGWGAVGVVHARQAQPQSQAGGFSWEYQLEFNADSLLSANQLSASLAPSLNSQQVASDLISLGGTSYRLTFSGSQGLEQVRQLLYSPLLAGFIGAAAEVEVEMPVGSLLNMPVMLDSNLSTGYRWELQSSKNLAYTQSNASTYTTRSRGFGVPAVQTLELQPSFSGSGGFRLIYRRPFEPSEAITRHLRLHLAAQALSLDLTDPHPQILGPLASPDTQPQSPNPIEEIPLKSTLPASLDWRTAGILTPVRNQGGCGSCWAFGTVGIMESAILKSGGPATNLSEQFLVSCNKSNWSCSGGWTAHLYHYDTLGRSQTAIGAVLEADKPYTATNGTCTVAYNHPYQLSDWHFIVTSESSMPTVEQIKNAIYTYGPVTAGVCADNGWNNYSGGVYSPAFNGCGGGTNHQIDLVGWDDATQTWIVRNSWGSTWGESGYMHLHWDPRGTTSRVGEGTSWVRIGPVPFGKNTPVDMATDLTTNPTLNWNLSSDADTYDYCLVPGLTYTCTTSWIPTDTATSVGLSGLANGTWSWQVRAHNAAGITEADSAAWWTFLVGPPHRAFLPLVSKK